MHVPRCQWGLDLKLLHVPLHLTCHPLTPQRSVLNYVTKFPSLCVCWEGCTEASESRSADNIKRYSTGSSYFIFGDRFSHRHGLPSQWPLLISLFLPPQPWDYNHNCVMVIIQFMGIYFRSSCLLGKPLTDRASPCCSLPQPLKDTMTIKDNRKVHRLHSIVLTTGHVCGLWPVHTFSYYLFPTVALRSLCPMHRQMPNSFFYVTTDLYTSPNSLFIRLKCRNNQHAQFIKT